MTNEEPDEALLWARGDWAKGLKSKGARRDAHQGLWDECLDDAVRGYRAGAAASEARIKALEDEVTALAVDLSQLIYLVECDGHNGDHQGCAVCEDIVNIRAEMKEADQ